jgi:hypothetical protein
MPFAEVRFDQGQMPVIACVNKATVNLGVEFDKLVAVLQEYLDQALVPIWGCPATLEIAADTLPGAWAMVFLDDADVAGDLGYHDLTDDGLPLSKVFVKTTLDAGEKVSVTASHELAEMLIDPAINLWAETPAGDFYAYEVADPVEEETFPIDGIDLSDFVFPSYFEGFRLPGSVQFDYLNRVTQPFQILPNGYSMVRDCCKVNDVFGSKQKAARFAKEDRRDHRSEHRQRVLHLRRSSAPTLPRRR